MKTRFAGGLSVLLLWGLPIIATAQFTCSTNNGAITITGYTGSGGAVVIPETTDGLPVVKIGTGAFSNKVTVTSIALPNNTTDVGTNAFYACVGLTNVSFGTGLLSIGPGAFYGCKQLPSVVMPDTVRSLGSNVFNQCGSLTNVVLSSALTNLGASLFQECSNLPTLHIPEGVTDIGKNAFYDCTNLTDVALGGNLRSIGDTAFAACRRLAGIIVPDSVTNLGFAVFGRCTGLQTAVIGNRVPTLLGTFDRCTALQSVVIGTNVGSISLAFEECGSLPTVVLPAALTSLSSTDFRNCTNLLAISIAPANPVYASVDGVLFDKSLATVVKFPGGKPGSYAVPDRVTSFDYGAFWECYALTNLWIGSGVTNMAYAPFDGSMKLQTIDVSLLNTVYSSLDGVLFDKNRTTLLHFPPMHSASYVVPAGTTAIEEYAFDFSASLTNVVIPASVQHLSSYVFFFCPQLTALAFEGDAPSMGDPYLFTGPGVTVYYLPGTAGWTSSFAQAPTAPWWRPNPTILTLAPSFGVRTNSFSFTISWATNASVVVEACTNLSSPTWEPVQTNTLANGTAYFSDPRWMNYPSRLYRLRSP